MLDPEAAGPHGDRGLFQWRGPRLLAMDAYQRRRVRELMAADPPETVRHVLWSERHDRAQATAQLG